MKVYIVMYVDSCDSMETAQVSIYNDKELMWRGAAAYIDSDFFGPENGEEEKKQQMADHFAKEEYRKAVKLFNECMDDDGSDRRIRTTEEDVNEYIEADIKIVGDNVAAAKQYKFIK